MNSPVTGSDFDPSAQSTSLCEAFRRKLLNNGLIKTLLDYLFLSDGRLNPDFAEQFVDLLQPVGSIQFLASDTGVDSDVWLRCDGAVVSRTTYAALFEKIGTTYGAGDGATTFGLPDMRGRFLLATSASKSLASTGGTETHALTLAEIPAHKHDFKLWQESNASAGGAWIETAVDKSATLNATLQTEDAGGGGAHNNMPPYIAMSGYIKANHKVSGTVL